MAKFRSRHFFQEKQLQPTFSKYTELSQIRKLKNSHEQFFSKFSTKLKNGQKWPKLAKKWPIMAKMTKNGQNGQNRLNRQNDPKWTKFWKSKNGHHVTKSHPIHPKCVLFSSLFTFLAFFCHFGTSGKSVPKWALFSLLRKGGGLSLSLQAPGRILEQV